MAKKAKIKIEPKKIIGRPSNYSEAMTDKICHAIATSNKGLNAICKEEGMPSPAMVYDWLTKHETFQEKYARAREMQADFLLEEIVNISDDTSNDTIETPKGDIPDNEWINRSRLRVDVRKWFMSKVHPKKYGDKIQTEHSGSVKLEQVTGFDVT